MLAFVALRDGCVTNEDELREHARGQLAGFEGAGKNLVPAELAERRRREDTKAGLQSLLSFGSRSVLNHLLLNLE